MAKKCCCGSKTEPLCNTEKNNICPICETTGIKVTNTTIRHMVIDELIELVGDADYFICMNEECDVIYFNLQMNKRFDKNQVKEPIWFKKDANPKYVCYCSKVTEGQVIKAVIEDGADSIKDVLNITGAMNNPQCQTKNPVGKCCHKLIEDAIDKGKSKCNL